MKGPIYIYGLSFLTILFLSCSSDLLIGKAIYHERNSKIIRGQLGGVNYVMLVTNEKNKYPLTVTFRKDMNPFFASKTTMNGNKYTTWHGVTDTTNNLFWTFGAGLVSGASFKDRSFIQVSQEDRRILNEFSDKLKANNSNLILSKDSINRLIGWVAVIENISQ